MLIGDRLRALRDEKKLSQGDVEMRTGLFRCYVSRVENGHTVPSIATLEKMARALEVPLYHLFYDREEPPRLPSLVRQRTKPDFAWGASGRDAPVLSRFRRHLSRMGDHNRRLLMFMAQRMARAVSAKPARRRSN